MKAEEMFKGYKSLITKHLKHFIIYVFIMSVIGLLLYKKEAKQRLYENQYQIGELYESGVGDTKDYTEADKLYLTKEMIEKENYLKAVKWYKEAAEQGYLKAQYQLGMMYSHKLKDDKEAFKWFKMAAEQGDLLSQLALADGYANGKGVTKDYKEAAMWYRKAANQESPEAMLLLALMYAKGEGVTKDYKEAIKWWRKVNKQFSFEILSVSWTPEEEILYFSETYKWILIAQINGHDVEDIKAALKEAMTPSLINEGEEGAKTYVKQQKDKEK